MHDAGFDAAAAGDAGATNEAGHAGATNNAQVNDGARDAAAVDMTDAAVAQGDAAARDPDAQTPLDTDFVVGVNIIRNSSAIRSGLIPRNFVAFSTIARSVSPSTVIPSRAANRTARSSRK